MALLLPVPSSPGIDVQCTNYTVVLTLIENGLLTVTDFSWPRMELKRFASLHLSSQCSRILSVG